MYKKFCFKCKQEKEISFFHKHKMMKDGHLNKCSSCVVLDVQKWRDKNPESRKKEYLKRKPKLGIFRTREEYIKEKQKHAKGRKTSLFEYTSKRRSQMKQAQMTELDLLVQEEAVRLRYLREKTTGIKWHIDHIVPLNHKDACGLHNAFNLQVVPAAWNLVKANKNMDVFFCRN